VDESRHRRRRLTLLLTPIVALVIASNVGTALFPTLVNDHPLLLITLDARNRHLALVATKLDAIPYYTVGFFRLVLSDPLFYLLGFWYGEAALNWMDRRAGSIGRFLRSMENVFAKAAYPLIFLAPNNYICLFAGASRMHPAAFIALNGSGTLFRLYLIRVVGEALSSPIDSVLDFIRRYQVQLTVGTIAIVVFQVVMDRRRGTSEIERVGELEHELEEEIDRVEAGDGPVPEDPAPE
jgi:membrane protein DedA with SNARE-associated domain